MKSDHVMPSTKGFQSLGRRLYLFVQYGHNIGQNISIERRVSLGFEYFTLSSKLIGLAQQFWQSFSCLPVASVIPPSVMENVASFGGRLGLCCNN